MSNLKWADVAHYYQFSVVCLRINGVEHPKEFLGVKIVGGLPFFRVKVGEIGAVSHKIDECTPILRALEDMTEGEAQELYAIIYRKEWDWRKYSTDCLWVLLDEVMFSNYGNDFKRVLGNPAVWSWLISKGFDVFGLIESGQAIRKEVESA